MPLCSNATFTPIGFGMLVRDIEHLYDRVGTNDGNIGADDVSQAQPGQTLQAPVTIDLGSGNTLTISADDLAGLSGLDIRLREVSVCVDGVQQSMIVLGSSPY